MTTDEIKTNEIIAEAIDKLILLYEIAQDRQQKERQSSVDKRLKELVDEGYSLREAQTIVGNEELMRYE